MRRILDTGDEIDPTTGPVAWIGGGEMTRCLVVANQTLGGSALISALEVRALESTIHIVVPATEPEHEHPPVTGTATGNAERRLRTALERLAAAGIRATGEVGDADPLRAISDALRGHTCEALIISTLPAGISRWVHADLPHRAAHQFNVTVEWIEAHGDAPNEATKINVIPSSNAKRFLAAREWADSSAG